MKYYLVLIVVLITQVVLFGCEDKKAAVAPILFSENLDPEYVYLVTEDVSVNVLIRAEETAQVGGWIPLNATRETIGQWEKVRRSELPDDVQWYPTPRNGFEKEVAANLSWIVEPSKNYEFDIATIQTAESMSRSVKFTEPGTYMLKAISSYPIRTASNTIEIRVEE